MRWRCKYLLENGVVCGALSESYAAAERHSVEHDGVGARIECEPIAKSGESEVLYDYNAPIGQHGTFSIGRQARDH